MTQFPKSASFSQSDITIISSEIISCDGFGFPSGHPKVYLKLSPKIPTECPYCARLFMRNGK